jgi:phosphoserine phosphatase RsbU/P
MHDSLHCNCPLDLDLDLARGVQQVLFPKNSPVCSWCCTGVKNRMAQGVGGDFFDIIPLHDGCQMVFIGDVTGHGLQAALVMALLYGYIHHSALQDCDAFRVASEINTFLGTFARRTERLDYFFSTTFFCGIINPKTLRMAYVNAGQVSPVVRTGQGLQRLAVTGPPLGYFPEAGLGLESHQFVRGDRLLLVTDGITEAFNARKEMFGRKRLEAVLTEHEGDHLEFLAAIFAALQAFGAEDPPRDDCTAMVIDLHGGIGN